MSNYLIRLATLPDIADLLIVEKSASKKFANLPSEFLIRLPENPPINDQSFYQNLITQNHSFVISNQEQIIGFITTEQITDEDTIHIWELDIDLAYQNQGLGKKLIAHVIEHAKQLNIRKITLTTFKDVPWNAPFYHKVGFSIIEKPNCRLNSLIDNEVKLGFPRDTRCAMMLVL